ncbi:MAG: hypothetical protein JSS32_10285 [Verrucomicrobia bacterium]|nr:hypothetical protein [Verrucomicrobiota bacterium]
MLELSPARKNKVNLADYNSSQDIENRIMMSDFTAFEHSVLEEILFSPLKVSLKKLSRAVDCADEEIEPILKKLTAAGLVALEGDSILVDKEMRKYFEFQITRFDSDFKPDMEFLQGLLKKVPIHILPTWYSIPRTSNNIFESIVEKYLLTPQAFNRYLGELNLGDPRIVGIIHDVYASPLFKVSSSDLISKYNLNRRDFEEIMVLLEFNFACCLSYEKEDDHWLEFATPFYEWRQYLLFLQETEAHPIEQPELVFRKRDNDFSFVEDMGAILSLAQKKPISVGQWQKSNPLPTALARELAHQLHLAPDEEWPQVQGYLAQVIEKLCLVKLADCIDGRLYALEAANDWLDQSLQNRALFLYRHPLNQTLSCQLPASLATERHLREAEKAIKRVLHGKWVYFDEFIKGVLVSLDEDSVVMLKRTGKTWRYTIPTYDEDKKALIRATFLEWLFETGMVAPGTVDGRDCFCATPFGRLFFES